MTGKKNKRRKQLKTFLSQEPQREQHNHSRKCHPGSPTSKGASRVIASPWPHHAGHLSKQLISDGCNELPTTQTESPALCSVCVTLSSLFARKGSSLLWMPKEQLHLSEVVQHCKIAEFTASPSHWHASPAVPFRCFMYPINQVLDVIYEGYVSMKYSFLTWKHLKYASIYSI